MPSGMSRQLRDKLLEQESSRGSRQLRQLRDKLLEQESSRGSFDSAKRRRGWNLPRDFPYTCGLF